jgi:uncharacterized protein (TIGR04255 family)
MTKLPKQINPCPINQAVVEIRFDSSLPPDAVFGVVYNALKGSYELADQLPILQIPEAVRNNDPKMQFQPHYQLKREDFIVQIGPKVIAIAVANQKYTSWKSYYKEIETVFNSINEIGFILNVSRVGLRYQNIFRADIWKNLNISLKIAGSEVSDGEVFVRTLLPKDGYKVLLQTGNSLNLEENDQIVGRVSIIDIDTSIEGESLNFFENMNSILEKGHSIEKEIFFGLLNPDFLNSLNPEY